ncbi:permease for cytosine/purines uracil thiamine allantoin [Sulfobacillus acidophilus DSM 10332]|uniref:Permease for cytosine/purines uracil thiamine allantoin n=1 Tax=Sulfobacillus acidophilus (strain ATCC 700253 / DSM 10332 / NAL) TaxID=679936 RepID=G8TVL9_SULAD|nr:permease for cytosine/purines uracil thiamine allantoin [Sulfobacillus acidophilus DSM 10332]
MPIEQHSVDFIPLAERHGKARDLLTLWFSANMQFTAITTGALAVVLGQSFFWAAVSIVVGNVVGGIFMAYHSAQGPKLGIPQMIQSRAQFGYYGAILPLLLVIVMYVGYFATSAVLGGQAISGWLHVPATAGILLVAAVCAVLAIYGYDTIHRYERYLAVIFAVAFLYLTVRMLSHPVAGGVSPHGFSFPTFLLSVSVFATWQITYAPYVADYSRYLAPDTPVSATFWTTYAGSVAASVWMMLLGAWAMAAASKAFNANGVAYVVGQAGPGLAGAFYLLIILGIIAANVLNLYGIYMSTMTTVSALRRAGHSQVWRIAVITAGGVAGTALAIWGQGNFLNNYSNFLLLLLYFLVPWTAINLTDFYLLRHGAYDIDAILERGPIYGDVNWRAMVAFVVSVAAEVPLMNTTLYQGPLSKLMGGADISWLVGIVVAGALYYGLMRGRLEAYPLVDARKDSRPV